MAMAAPSPFSEEGRRRRLVSGPQPYSQYPAGASVNPVALPQSNPDPQMEEVTSQPNQLNLAEGEAYPINEAFLEWYQDRDNAGTGFLPVPTPYMTYQQERDQENGDYLSRGFQADWSGVPQPVSDLQQFYLEPVVGRLNRSIQDENAERQKVRDVMQPQSYMTEREVRNVNPQTGQSYSTFAPQRGYQPFFPVESLFI